MGFDMRVPSGRCPSILIAGCILLYVVLLCNWWSLSSQNYDLANQITILEEQMKLCCEERDQCTNDKNRIEILIGELKVKRDNDETDYEAALKKKENNLSMCKTELESLKIVDASKTQSLEALRTTIDEKKEEILRLNEQIKHLNTVTTDRILAKNHDDTQSAAKLEDGLNNKNGAIDGTIDPAEIKEDGERDQEMGNNIK